MKNKDVGEFGENYLFKLLEDNNINYTDHRDDTEEVDKILFTPNTKTKHTYKSIQLSHKFDFTINNKNIEVKTAIANQDSYICANWTKNDRKAIDYVILFVIDNNFKVKYIYIFDNDYINKHLAVKIKLEIKSNIKQRHANISKKELLNILTYPQANA